MTTHPFDKLDLDDGAAVILAPCLGTKGVSLRDSLSQLEHGMPYEQVVAEVQRIRPKALQLDAHVNCLEQWKS